MLKIKLNHLICLASVLIALPSLANTGDLENVMRGPNNTAKTFTHYYDRPDLGVLQITHPVDVNRLFSGLPKNSQVANEIKVWSQEGLEELYSNLSSGPIPHSDSNGEILFDGDALTGAEGVLKRIGEIFPTPPGPIAALNNQLLKTFVTTLWHGKKFIPQPGKLSHVLVNRIGNGPELVALVQQLSGEEKIETVGDTAIPGGGLLGKLGKTFGMSGEAVSVGGEKYMMPAKVYCGESLLDTRRESIIIDYAYSEDVLTQGGRFSDPGQRIPPHRALVNRHGLNVRDEIRMIRPGLYLGRAYVQSAFVLHFILHKDSGFSSDTEDECHNPYKTSSKITSL